MKIALAQMDITWEDKEKNKEKTLKFIESAKQNNVDLILFPEMCLTGFSMNVEYISESTDTLSGTVDWFLGRSSEFNLHIGFGYVMKDPSAKKGLNKFTIVSPSQGIISDYAKIHPFSFGLESQHYVGGNTINTTPIKDFNITTFICYDLRFPEIFQIASRNSNLITVSANWPKSRREHWITLLKARAIENQCYIAGINRVGIGDNIEYCGDSMVIDPYGNILCQSEDNETLLLQDIDACNVTNIRKNFRLKDDRREDLYKELSQKLK